MSKCGVFSGPYILVFIPKMGRYRPEETLHLDTFHAASIFTRNWASYWWSLEDDSVNYYLLTKSLKMKPHSISSIYFPRQLPHILTETLKCIFTNSSTDNLLSPFPVSDWLIFCYGNSALHHKINENNKNKMFLMKSKKKF